VFHSHYASGNFTTPGTGSLLTGTYPWSHQALHIQGTVLDEFRNKNIFSLLGEKGYFRIGFSHNIVATSLLDQFRLDIDTLQRQESSVWLIIISLIGFPEGFYTRCSW